MPENAKEVMKLLMPSRFTLVVLLPLAAINVMAMTQTGNGWYGWALPPLLIAAGWATGFIDGMSTGRKLP